MEFVVEDAGAPLAKSKSALAADASGTGTEAQWAHPAYYGAWKVLLK